MSVQELIDQGYESTSNKYRTVARLPPGKTGVEALREVSPHDYALIVYRIEQQCASAYRRIYAQRNGDQIELSVEEFRQFKQAGGKVSW